MQNQSKFSYKAAMFASFAGPAVFLFSAVVIVPFLFGFYLTFTGWDGISSAIPFVGFANYAALFKDGTFWVSMGKTILYAFAAVLLANAVAFGLALLVTGKIKGSNFFRAAFYTPNLIGGIVLGYTWQQMINAVLYKYETTIVANAKFGFWGLVLLMNWQMVGYMMIIYIAGLQNVPTELIEAAKIDGATPWQTLIKVKIPMVMSSITICMFLTLSNSFKLFDQNKALTDGAPMKKTQMLALNIYETFYGRTGYEGVGQAKAVVFFIIVVAIALVQLTFTRSKEVEQ